MWTIAETLPALLAVAAVFYFWFRYHYSYWKRRNMPYVTPIPIFGNFGHFLSLRIPFEEQLQKLYNQKYKEPVIGIFVFQKPGLLIKDLDLVKNILVKDFNIFCNRFVNTDPHFDSLGANNLFFVKNPLWKEIRAKLTPTFSSGKIKQMYPLMLEVGASLESYMDNLPFDPNSNSYVDEIREICALFTTDMIVSIAFGLNANSLTNPKGEFRTQGKKVFALTLFRIFEGLVVFFLPYLVKIFRPKVFSKETSNFLRETIRYTIKEREKSGEIRGDLIDTLVALKKEAADSMNQEHFGKSFDFLVAQAAVFLTAGYETTSSTINFALYELAKHQNLQQRLRNEILETLLSENGSISYEKIHEMEYLNMVINETLRFYPIIPFLDRECSLTGNDLAKGYSIKPFHDFNIPHGMPIYIPTIAIQRDPKYWPNPDVFDPERFSEKNKRSHTPYAYLPFGTGPRNCIGSRVGLLQTRLGLIHFLKNHYVTCCDKTIPIMKFDPKGLFLQPLKGKNYLKIIKDNMFLNKIKASS